MSRETLSNFQLLDMAREVLSICTDNSLTDILKDLEMTHSSVLTINRIFDGQFLSPLEPEVVPSVAPDPPQQNTPQRNIPAVVQCDYTVDDKNLVVLLSSSEDEDSNRYNNHPRHRQKSATVKAEPGLGLENVPPPSRNGSNVRQSVKTENDPWLFNDDPPKPTKEGSWSPEKFNHDINDGPRIESVSTRSKTLLPFQDAEWERTIDIQINPRKKLEVSHTKTTLGSASKKLDPLTDWTFDDPADRDERLASQERSLSPICASKKSDGTGSYVLQTSASTLFSSSASKRDWSDSGIDQHATSKLSSGSESLAQNTPTLTATSRFTSTTKRDWSDDDLDWTKTSPYSSPYPSQRNQRASSKQISPPLSSRPSSLPSVVSKSNRYVELSDDETDNNPGSPSLRDLIDRSLSPPIMLQDESDNTEDEDLMMDVFSGNTKKKTKGLKKTLSANRLSQSKKRPRPSTPDLNEWDMSDPGSGSSSLRTELDVTRKARRRTRGVNGDDYPDEDKEKRRAVAAELALKKAARDAKDAEQQRKQKQKEEAKSAKEAEQRRKRELKDQERSAKEEERLAEKRAARDMRIANRLTTKSEGVKEMILCMEDALLATSFGQAVEDYLTAVECNIQKQKTTNEQTGASRGSTPSEQSIMFWRRTVINRFDEEQDQFIRLGSPEIDLEPFALIYMTGTHFAAMIEQDRLRSDLEELKRDMRIRKNKEKIKQSSQTVKLKEDRLQRQRVIYLINGLEEHIRKLKKVNTKRFQYAVLARMGQAPAIAALDATTEQDSVVDEERIEQELLWLQLEQDCLVVQAANEEESALNVVSLTEQIGLRPYKESRKSKLNVCVDGIKSGSDPSDTWIKSLQEIHMVTMNMAKSIADIYPTIKSLYEGYRKCETLEDAENMLTTVGVLGRNNRIGKGISRRIFDIFMSEDPNRPVRTMPTT